MLSSSNSVAHESNDGGSIGDSFVPMAVMPTSRLNDVYKVLTTRPATVVNLDALLPPREAGEQVFQTLLFVLPNTVKTLSVRFNNLSPASIELLIDYIFKNENIETLYVMGSGFEEKMRMKLEDAWKKHLVGHRTDNLGYTFMRVTLDKKIEAEKAEALA
eukprot:gene8600-11620_t